MQSTTLQSFQETDLPHLGALQPPGWNDLAVPFRWYLDSEFCTPVKAARGGVLVGVGAAIRFGVTAWVGHVIVHPEYRRQGIATRIMEHLLGDLSSSGCSTISLIASDEGYPVYKRLGFVQQSSYQLLERSSGPRRDPGGGAAASRDAPHGRGPSLVPAPGPTPTVEPALARDAARILEIDRLISGEDRSAIHPGPAQGDATGYHVVREGGRAAGFFCPGLGDGLVYATSEAAGEAILRYRLSTVDRIGMPEENSHGIEVARRHGFVTFRTATRMILGAAFPWKPESVYGRIGGNLG